MILTNLLNFLWTFFQYIDRLIAHIVIVFILAIRPLLGPNNICPFFIGCTPFAIQQLKNKTIPIALFNIIFRLLRCNPLWLWLNHNNFHKKKL